MLRILIPAAMVVGTALLSRPASAQPLSLVGSLPVIASLLGLAVLGAAVYLPRRERRGGPAEPREGRQYQRLRQPQPVASTARTEIVVVFSYDDPMSYRLEPLLSRWQREYRGTVDLVRLPGLINEQQVFYARTYYTACMLGLVERLHGSLFDALHVANLRPDNEDKVTGFFSDQGVDPAAWRKTFHSSAVQNALRKAEMLNRGYEIESVPTVIVNGLFKITPQTTVTLPRLLGALDHLVATSRKAEA